MMLKYSGRNFDRIFPIMKFLKINFKIHTLSVTKIKYNKLINKAILTNSSLFSKFLDCFFKIEYKILYF